MIDELNALLAQAKDELSRAGDEAQVEAARIKYLGKKGSLSAVLRGMGKLAPEERPRVGEAVNSVKAGIEDLLERARQAVAGRALEADLRREKLDVTLPGRPQKLGHRHPVSQAMRSEEHTSELQSRSDLVCRLLLEKKKKNKKQTIEQKKKKKTTKKITK